MLMIIQYNAKQLNRIINNIFVLTGISISILDSNHNVLASCSKKQDFCSLSQTFDDKKMLCSQCDQKILKLCESTKKLESHICWAGLYDSAMPIIKNDTVVGFVIMGRIRSERSPALPQILPDDDPHTLEQLYELYSKLPFMTETKLSALYDLLSYILFEPSIQIVYDSFINKAIDFIDTHLHEDLSVGALCNKFHISKNYLYKAFSNNLGSSVNEYIATQRLKRAKEMLTICDEPVYIVAEKVGIYNYTYFCRWFKKRMGISPNEYRKASRK
jgi:AraC-like DNA-binding protein